MCSLRIRFKAYIPKSLGKSLISYFEQKPLFNPKILSNYHEFKSKLETIDSKGYSWLPEPGNFATGYYFSTDKIDFHNAHTAEHTSRLCLDLAFEGSKIGFYSMADKSKIINHPEHENSNKYGQHSDESHRVEAYIKTVSNTVGGMNKVFDSTEPARFEGVCNAMLSKRSKEAAPEFYIKNKVSGTYFTNPGTKVKEDSTVVKASASAGYPFLETVSQNIDFNITATLYLSNKTVEITVEGEHNDFPAYELLVDNEVLYNYNPAEHGYSGPTPYNLGIATTKFSVKTYRKLTDIEVKEFKLKNSKNIFGY